MSVNVRVVNHEENGAAVNIIVDFNARILSTSVMAQDTSNTFYFSFSTSSSDTDDNNIPTLVAESNTDLVLNGEKRRQTDSAVAYTDFTEMIEDYLYDIVNGHNENQHGVTIDARSGIQFQ